MYKVELDFDWVPVINGENRYRYPANLNTSLNTSHKVGAVYRWVIYDELNNIISLYIGETDNVVRRIKGYLKPGPSQMTNIRMKSQFENYIKIGYQIHLEIMKINGFKLNGREYLQESLSDPCIRKLIENLVIIEEKNKGFDLLNAKV